MAEVFELRQYTLLPGRRDELITLFDREFVETQEACGMRILGQFRDLDRPDRFVWVRGFPSMAARFESLTAFYRGPVWRAHRATANATMIDTDNVHLLRPVSPFTVDATVRDVPPSTLVLATIHYPTGHPDEPSLSAFGATLLGTGETEPADNDYPALPIRSKQATVWFASFPSESALAEWLHSAPPARTEHLRLAPTPRSLLR
jgi:NIPSNAP